MVAVFDAPGVTGTRTRPRRLSGCRRVLLTSRCFATANVQRLITPLVDTDGVRMRGTVQRYFTGDSERGRNPAVNVSRLCYGIACCAALPVGKLPAEQSQGRARGMPRLTSTQVTNWCCHLLPRLVAGRRWNRCFGWKVQGKGITPTYGHVGTLETGRAYVLPASSWGRTIGVTGTTATCYSRPRAVRTLRR